jgi:hypothetical protein
MYPTALDILSKRSDRSSHPASDEVALSVISLLAREMQSVAKYGL